MSNSNMRANNMGQRGAGGSKIDKEKAKEYVMSKVIQPDLKDSEFWQLIKVVPKNSIIVASIGLVLNIILPGFGTILSACMDQRGDVSKAHLTIGMLQFFTAVFLFGWIWAIYWSYLIFVEA